jgi:hypothetical protein
MAEKDTEQRAVMLFADYTSLLRVDGFLWIIEDCPKLAVEHIVDALNPKQLQSRVREDLEFVHSDLKKDFLKFMDHVTKPAEMYTDYEKHATTTPPKVPSCSKTNGKGTSNRTSAVSSQQTSTNPAFADKGFTNKTKELPDCLNHLCNEKHYLKECKNTSKTRKDELYAERAQARKSSGDQRVTSADEAGRNNTTGNATDNYNSTIRGVTGANSSTSNSNEGYRHRSGLRRSMLRCEISVPTIKLY